MQTAPHLIQFRGHPNLDLPVEPKRLPRLALMLHLERLKQVVIGKVFPRKMVETPPQRTRPSCGFPLLHLRYMRLSIYFPLPATPEKKKQGDSDEGNTASSNSHDN